MCAVSGTGPCSSSRCNCAVEEASLTPGQGNCAVEEASLTPGQSNCAVEEASLTQ